MPKRTNQFQQLIYLIQDQLQDDAVVTESKMLKDNMTDELVEVDIVVEFTKGAIPIVIGFECTARTKPADRTWANAMVGKHKTLPTDKVVLASKSGFTRGARKFARATDCEIVTLEQAEGVNWTAYFNQLQNLMLAGWNLQPVSCTVGLETHEADKTQAAWGPNPKMRQEQEKQTLLTTLKEFTTEFLNSQKVGLEVVRGWLKHPQRERKETFEVIIRAHPPDAYIEDETGKYRKILDLKIQGKAHVRTTPLSLQPSKFMGVDVAHGTAKNIFDQDDCAGQEVHVTLVQQEKERPKGALMFPSRKGDQRVFSMKFIKEQSEKETD